MQMIKITRSKSDFQTTLKTKLKLVGRSAYSTRKCTVDIMPAQPDSGLVFQLKDSLTPVSYHNFITDPHSHTTSLGAQIRSVEHLLSALWGMGVDNALIVLHEGEIPFLDASAAAYSQKIKQVGLKRFTVGRKYVVFSKPVRFTENDLPDKDAGWAVFKPSQHLKTTATIKFENLIGQQKLTFKWSPQEYLKQISWARTFIRSPLDEQGQKWARIRQTFPILSLNPAKSPIIVFDQKGVITPLKQPDEFVRHKVLDFLGDIALLGVRLKADIEIYKPGHQFNYCMVKELGEGLER